jgi:hypothetical protein
MKVLDLGGDYIARNTSKGLQTNRNNLSCLTMEVADGQMTSMDEH